MNLCHGPGCEATKLIKSHIIPRAFGRMLKAGGNKHNMSLSLSRVQPAQLGVFDKNILCEKCDGLLGKHDDYLYDVIRTFNISKCPSFEGIFVDQSVDCERFSKGVLAILWRASISNRFPYSKLSLGKYESIAQEVLFGLRTLQDFHQFELLVQYYQSAHFGHKIRFFQTVPQHNRFGNLSGFSFALNGFRISAKIDEQSFGPLFQPFVINRRGIFRGIIVELEETPEFGGMRDIAVADLIRRSRRHTGKARIRW